MIKKYPLFLQAATIVALYSTGAFAHEDGDALQLQTYIVESAADRPNVADGLLSTSGEEDDWKAAYARQITGRAVGGTTRDATIFFANEDDSLYLAVSIPSINTGNGQGFFMYFDLNNNGVLDGTAGTPGEYAISSLKDGAVSLFTEYGWNGSTWVANTIQTPGIKHGFGDGGAGGNHVFNFEIQLPILSTAPNAGQAFPDFSPGDEVGIMTVLTPAAGETTGNLFWDSAGTSVINPALWGELLINTALSSPRRFASLDAKTYVPTVTDGNITDDPNWKYAFDKTVTFSDFNGHKLSNCRIVIKESGAGTLYFGARITDNVFNDGDYFQIYFDQGDAGGAMNYTLNSGGSKNDDAMRVNGDGTTSDLYFNATGAGAWETDGGSNVTGGADSVSGAAWEFELAKPMASGDANDLGITSGQEVGILFRYYDADNTIDYWWSGSVNSDQMKLDLSNNNWNALGWAELVTGGPFVQPLYPEQNDIISGTYPFMLYAEDESSVAQIDSVDYRITDLNDNIVINYSSSTRMTKVDNASSGIWISTFNTNTGSTPDGDYNVVFRVKDNDGISVVAPVRIRIQNSGTVGGPTISNMSLNTGDVVAGTYRLTFDISPSGVYTLVADSIQISIDGGAWTVVDSTPAITGGTGRDSVNTAAMSDGVHTIRLRAKDSGNLAWGYSDLVIFNVNNSGSSSNVVIDSITGGSLKSGSVTVYFTATAGPNSVVDSCQISVDGLTWVRTTTGSSHTLNTVVLTEGTHLLQVRAFGSNNTTGYSRNASIETANGPTVTVTAPAADSAVSGTVVVTFTATPVAPATIDSTATAISVDGGAYRATSTASTDTLDTQALTEGAHTVQIKVTDSNGKTGLSELRKFVVRNSPTVTLAAPAADSVVSGTVVVTFTATPVAPAAIDSTAISVDGGAYRATSTASTDTLDTQALTEGAHTVQIKVTDFNGKTGISELRKFVVRNSPTVMLTVPAADSVVSGTVVVTFTATPVAPAAIDSTAIAIDGGAYRATSTYATDTLDTEDIAEGAHTVKIRVIDSNGKTGFSELRKFIVRNNPAVTLLSPYADTVIIGTAIVRFSALPVSPATIARREIFIDGVFFDTSGTESTFAWNTVNYNDGQHTVQVRVIDSNGKKAASDIVSVTLLNTPVVTIDAPTDTVTVFGIDTIRFTIDYAPGTSRDSTEVSFDGGEWQPTSADASHTWVTTDFRDGTHTVQVRVSATNGKTGYSQIRAYEVSNAPTADIIAPAPGEALAGAYTVRFRIDPVAPATIRERKVSIDGGPWRDSLVRDSTFTMNTIGWKNGTHSIQVRGIDSRGRIGNSRILSFIVDNEAPLAADPKAVYGETASSAKSGSDVLVTALIKDNLVGLKRDSAVVLTSASIDEDGAATYLMRDDGEGGDKVKGDNVYSALVEVATDSTGSIGYSIKAVDQLGNSVTLASAITLDNAAPATDFTLEPVPEDGVDARSGTTYFRRLVMKGNYGDKGSAGLSQVFIAVKNDSGAYVNTAPVVLAPEDSQFSSIVELIPGNNTIVLCAVDRAGNRDSTLGRVVYREPKATKVVSRSGGMVDNPDGASAVIPKDALLKQVEVTIVPVEPVEQRKPLNKTLTLLNVAHDFGPNGTIFRKPVTLTLPYTGADLDQDQDGSSDIDPEKLIVVFWDGGTWRPAGPGSVNADANTVTVEVNHFTIFDLALSTATAPGELVACWSANPVRKGRGAYFTYSVPENGTVSLRIVDMAGDLVCQLLPATTRAQAGPVPGQVAWSGHNTAGRFAGAGLYVYVFAFKPGSGGDTQIIRKPVGLLYSEEGR